MTEPAPYDEKVTPAVTLGGKKWPIPLLAIRQLRHIREPLRIFTERLNKAAEDDKGGGAVFDLPYDEYEALIVEPVYQGITRAHPEMKRDEFLDLAASEAELLAAWFVVRTQSRVFRPAPVKGEGQPGEAMAGETKSQTGT